MTGQFSFSKRKCFLQKLLCIVGHVTEQNANFHPQILSTFLNITHNKSALALAVTAKTVYVFCAICMMILRPILPGQTRPIPTVAVPLQGRKAF